MTEDQLVRRIATGSERAFRDLYEMMSPSVFGLLFRMTEDRHLAEDLTHDTFIIVHEKAHQYRGRCRARGWILRIAGNLARERLRTHTRRREILRAGTARSAIRPAPDRTDRMELQSAMTRLDATSRLVVMLHAVEGFSHREIADALGVAEGTSRSRLSRALAQLREFMDPSPNHRSSVGAAHER